MGYDLEHWLNIGRITVDPTDADAVPGDVASGKTFYAVVRGRQTGTGSGGGGAAGEVYTVGSAVLPVTVGAGYVLKGNSLKASAVVVVESGGSAVSNTVSSGATLVQRIGSTESGNVASGGRVVNSAGADYAGEEIAYYVHIENYTLECTMWYGAVVYSSGAESWMDSAIEGGELDIQTGATANSATVLSGGILYIMTGGAANYTAVSSGGLQVFANAGGGMDNHTTVSAGGSLRVRGPASISTSATILSGGSLTVSSGGSAIDVYSATGAIVTSAEGAYITYRQNP